jgi:hypothetical protein
MLRFVLTERRTHACQFCCGVLLLTVWPVRGSFPAGDLALVSPMSVHVTTHLVTLPSESRSILYFIDPSCLGGAKAGAPVH